MPRSVSPSPSFGVTGSAGKINATPVTINIIQIYAPTTAYDKEDLEEFYDDLNKAMKMCKNREATIVMRDWNAKVGNQRSISAAGPFGLGERN